MCMCVSRSIFTSTPSACVSSVNASKDDTVAYSVGVQILAELHADVFSRHASPFEVCVFAAVDERGEDVMSDDGGRRCNGKQQRKRRGSQSVRLPD